MRPLTMAVLVMCMSLLLIGLTNRAVVLADDNAFVRQVTKGTVLQVSSANWPWMVGQTEDGWWWPDTLTASLDRNHIAFVGIVVPGISIDLNSRVIGPASTRSFASVDSRAMDRLAGPNDAADARAEDERLFNLVGDMTFSTDGQHFAYAGMNLVREPNESGKQNLDMLQLGLALGHYRSMVNSIALPTASNLGGEAFIVADGVKVGPFDGVLRLWFDKQAPEVLTACVRSKGDGKLVTVAIQDGKAVPVEDEPAAQTEKPWKIAQPGEKECWLELEGRRWGPYEACERVQLSSDKQHAAYVAQREGFWQVYIDGEAVGKPSNWRYNCHVYGWSPDDRSCSFRSWLDDKNMVVMVNQHELAASDKLPDWVGWVPLQASWLPCCVVTKEGKRCVVIGSELGTWWDDVVTAQVCPDGTITYVAREGGSVCPVRERLVLAGNR